MYLECPVAPNCTIKKIKSSPAPWVGLVFFIWLLAINWVAFILNLRMTESKRKQLILDCRIYVGSEDPAFPGYYEECWIRFHDKDEAYLDAVTQEYISAGLKDFSSDDGTPISLKAVLFNRYIHWGNPYNYEEECRGLLKY